MILESLKYISQEGKPNEWTLAGKDNDPVQFGNTNLIVGKNAAGKSRTLSIVAELANILGLRKTATSMKTRSWNCDLVFAENGDLYNYHIWVENDVIANEVLSVNGIEKVNRKEKQIYSELNHRIEELVISDKEVVISLKDNDKEYPYLAEIYEWGSALKRFTFTNQFEKNRLLKTEELENFKKAEGLDPNNVIHLFQTGKQLYGEEFVSTIIDDMKHLDYSVDEVVLEYTQAGVGISVHEEELSESTTQLDMSQGMFRALAFLIQMNYALFSRTSVCLLIDDLGEGLDFSRSKLLIDILIHKIDNSDIQMFITTNDRYVMNTIPIKYWSILERKPKASLFYNYYNSKETFEDFKYTGLNNFDFLATDFYLHGFENEEQDI